jgi:aspartate-semialdehyde dehydrogenase
MTGQGGLRIALAGASGALAREVLAAMEERGLPVDEIRPFATEASLGQEIEFRGELIPIEAGLPSLHGVDMLFLCAPRAAALDLVRDALRAEVFCIDCSGSLAGSAEVPLLVSDLCSAGAVLGAPVISTPVGPALAWSLVLAPLARVAGLERVVGTVLQSVSHAGRAGIEVLSRETIALLGQQDLPESELFPGPIAFDCAPAPGPACQGDEGNGGESDSELRRETDVARDVRRLVASVCLPEGPGGVERPDGSGLDGDVPGADNLRIAVNAVQVPIFVGDGSALAIQTERPLSPAEAGDLLQKAAGVKLWEGGESGPSMRDAASQDVALVGRLRRDASIERGLLLWVTADPLQLAANNVVKLAESRLRLN